MRIDPDTCRDPDLLAAEVRRLRAVIAECDPPPASTGSVCEPVAWLVTGDGYEYATLLKEHAEVIAEEDGVVVPLYRKPTLTDEERWAVTVAMGIINERNYGWPDGTTPPQDTLRGLLKRTK